MYSEIRICNLVWRYILTDMDHALVRAHKHLGIAIDEKGLHDVTYSIKKFKLSKIMKEPQIWNNCFFNMCSTLDLMTTFSKMGYLYDLFLRSEHIGIGFQKKKLPLIKLRQIWSSPQRWSVQIFPGHFNFMSPRLIMPWVDLRLKKLTKNIIEFFCWTNLRNWVVEKLHPNLEEYLFTVCTVHSSIQWLKNLQDSSNTTNQLYNFI